MPRSPFAASIPKPRVPRGRQERLRMRLDAKQKRLETLVGSSADMDAVIITSRIVAGVVIVLSLVIAAIGTNDWWHERADEKRMVACVENGGQWVKKGVVGENETAYFCIK